MTYTCYASAAFGLEGLVASELRSLPVKNVSAENGGVVFSAESSDLFRCNLCLRFCDRVYILAGQGICRTFEDLFQLVYAVPWELYSAGNEFFHLSAKCIRSQLMSPRDCQSISKKAILERLKKKKGLTNFPENGNELPVLISVRSDQVRILINTSGDALSRRGYRTWNGEAPLRETLAAALVKLSPWDCKTPLVDPCCGTGTILIEAAFLASGRAPGISRSFMMENFHFLRDVDFSSIRKSLSEKTNFGLVPGIYGTDINPDAIKLASRHIRQANVPDIIHLEISPFQKINRAENKGVFICNPPYGERLSDQKTCRLLIRDLRSLKDRHAGWSLCAISSDPAFEKVFGKHADQKRRLYNGRLECVFYIYY